VEQTGSRAARKGGSDKYKSGPARKTFWAKVIAPSLMQRRKVGPKSLLQQYEEVHGIIAVHPKVLKQARRRANLGWRETSLLRQHLDHIACYSVHSWKLSGISPRGNCMSAFHHLLPFPA
jgi:hypothetical protein